MNYLRYTGVFLGVAVFSTIVVLALNTWANAGLGSAGQLLAPAMIAALLEGRAFVRRETRIPDASEAWSFALIATGLAVALNIVLSYVSTQLIPVGSALSVGYMAARGFWIMLVLHTLVYLLSNRFFLGYGARSEQTRRSDTDAT